MLKSPRELTMLAGQAGIAVPDNPDLYFPLDYPHFFVLCYITLNREVMWECVEYNARVIAALPVSRLQTVTDEELHSFGCRYPKLKKPRFQFLRRWRNAFKRRK